MIKSKQKNFNLILKYIYIYYNYVIMKKRYLALSAALITPTMLVLISCSSNQDNPKKISLIKNSFEATELGISSTIDQFNISSEWIFNKKNVLFNNEYLIKNLEDITNLKYSKQNNNLNVEFSFLSDLYQFRIINFYKEDQPNPPIQQELNLIRNSFEAKYFGLQDQFVNSFNPQKDWIFSNKAILFSNHELLTNSDQIIDFKTNKPNESNIIISFSVFSKNFQITISSFKQSPTSDLSLKSTIFNTETLGIVSSKNPWMADIDYSLLWRNKKTIFNNYHLIEKDIDLENITTENNNIEGEKIVNFTFKNKKFNFKITNFKKQNSFIQKPFDDLNSYQSGNKLSMLGTYIRKITNENVQRTLSEEKYQTKLLQENSNFKYPAYDYNYKTQNLNDLARKVMDERVDFNDIQVKYSDANWIKEEIKNNTLKRHPAADGFLKQNKYDFMKNAKAVQAKFQISTPKIGVIPLGLYAPPGEVVTLTLDDETFNFFKELNNKYSLAIVINTNFLDNADVGQQGQISNRYPYVQTSFELNKDDKTLKFGTPFGGSISIEIKNLFYNSNNSFYQSFYTNMVKLKFEVSGAIESLFYVHGVTTKEEWDKQIQKVSSKEIASPIFSGYFTLGGLNIPFKDETTIGYDTRIANIEYPYEVFQKWFEFLSLSNFYSYNGLTSIFKGTNFTVNMRFYDDIAFGAAYATGDSIQAPIDWGVSVFLKGIERFNSIKNSWGLFHETNHLLDAPNALFSKRDHYDTNQATLASLSLLIDSGRWRSPFNIGSEFSKPNDFGWTRLGNSYVNIKTMDDKDYRLFASILYTIGTYNYINYVKWDVKNHPNSAYGWEGLDEIRVLSNFFKLNFWPTFNKYNGGYNNWLKLEDEANEKQKAMIKEMSQYPAVDFVGNLYAAGIYLYDSINKDFVYTNDVISPYEIPAGQNYTFDFGTFINSTNPNFDWEDLQFTSSKTGATIELDSSNSKRLIYKPNKDKLTEIDEFNISIKPKKWSGRVDSYVPLYKWKIKVRQVVNRPTIKVYDFPISSLNGIDINLKNDLISKMESNDEQYIVYKGLTKIPDDWNQSILNNELYNSRDKKRGFKIEFDFIVPEIEGTKNIAFELFSYNYTKLIIKNVNKNTTKEKSGQSFYIKEGISAEKGDIIKVSFLSCSTLEANRLKASIEIDRKEIDITKNILMPDIYNMVKNKDVNDLLSNKNYQYKNRELNYFSFDSGFGELYYPSQTNNNWYKKDDYTLSLNKDLNTNLNSFVGNLENLKDIYNTTDYGIMTTKLVLDVEFTKKSKLGLIVFKNQTSNSYSFPTNLKVVSLNDQNQETEVLYQQIFENRTSKQNNIFKFNKVHEVKRIRMYILNEIDDAISFAGILLNKDCYQLNTIVSATDNSSITYSSGWSKIINDFDTNISDVNNSSMKSTTINSSIEFRLNAQGFNIVGQKNTTSGKFDIYIDDKLVGENISTTSDKRVDNSILFSFINEQNKKKVMKIKIVHKDNNPLYINSFETYGTNVEYI